MGATKPSRQSKSAQSEQPTAGSQTEFVEQIWQIVAMIPKGKVASYGQVAGLAGKPSHARFVGRTLSNLPKKTRLPWHRVVNASLRISERPGSEIQQRRLEKEGISLVNGRVPKGHHWQP